MLVRRKFDITLPKEVEFIIDELGKESPQELNVACIGGAVRDSILGLKPKDWDIATSVDYDRILEIFKDYEPKEIGKSFGIVQVKINNQHFEIAKFRKDIGLPENRHEQQVEFTNNLEEDLKRRDFTVNAIAYYKGNLIADQQSFTDIECKTISFVGNPYDRIKEDPLRAFRYVRFIAQKGLEEEGYLRHVFESNKDAIATVSKERIRDEFMKILMSDGAKEGFNLLRYYGLLDLIIPNHGELRLNQRNPHHDKNVFHHIMEVVKAIPKDPILRLSALFHDIGKPNCFTIDENGVGHFYGHDKEGSRIARETMTMLKFDNETINTVCLLVENHMNKHEKQSPKSMRRLIAKIGAENVERLFKLMSADIIGSKAPYNFTGLDKMKITFHEVMKEANESPIFKITDLKINGHDVMSLGFKGKDIGSKLKQAHEYVLENGSKGNDRNILMELIKNV